MSISNSSSFRKNSIIPSSFYLSKLNYFTISISKDLRYLILTYRSKLSLISYKDNLSILHLSNRDYIIIVLITKHRSLINDYNITIIKLIICFNSDFLTSIISSAFHISSNSNTKQRINCSSIKAIFTYLRFKYTCCLVSSGTKNYIMSSSEFLSYHLHKRCLTSTSIT